MKLEDSQYWMYVGAYTRNENEGIYAYRFDTESGAMTRESVTTGIHNPSFVAIHPNRNYLYSVSETGQFNGKPSGAVAAFAIDAETGSLTLLNQQASMGSGPCHVSVDGTGRYLLAANYGSGSVSILPIQEDGSLAEATDFAQHEGNSADPGRQKGPHAHSINLDPTNRYALAPDLGLDKVMIYRIDFEQGKLVPNSMPWAEIKPGAGPRHLAFHPNGTWCYVINELDSTVTAFTYDGQNGSLSEIQHVSTLPQGYTETTYCADIHVSSCGRFAYGSNRGHDSIVIFGVDQETGILTALGYESTQGSFPRNFALDPTGNFLIAANQNGNNMVSYRIDSQTGLLEPTGHNVEVSAPVCIKFL